MSEEARLRVAAAASDRAFRACGPEIKKGEAHEVSPRVESKSLTFHTNLRRGGA